MGVGLNDLDTAENVGEENPLHCRWTEGPAHKALLGESRKVSSGRQRWSLWLGIRVREQGRKMWWVLEFCLTLSLLLQILWATWPVTNLSANLLMTLPSHQIWAFFIL